MRKISALFLTILLFLALPAQAAVTPMVVAGHSHSLALMSDGTVWAWGLNATGQLGDGTTTDRFTPVQVRGENGVSYLTGVTAISAGWNHSLALRDDGTVWAWGNNSQGQIGDGTTTNRSTPVLVIGLPVINPINHTVTFNTHGGLPVPPNQTVPANSTITRPTDPARAGFVFGGWYREAAGINPWNFNTDTVTVDMTLHARWSTTGGPPGGGTPPPGGGGGDRPIPGGGGGGSVGDDRPMPGGGGSGSGCQHRVRVISHAFDASIVLCKEEEIKRSVGNL